MNTYEKMNNLDMKAERYEISTDFYYVLTSGSNHIHFFLGMGLCNSVIALYKSVIGLCNSLIGLYSSLVGLCNSVI